MGFFVLKNVSHILFSLASFGHLKHETNDVPATTDWVGLIARFHNFHRAPSKNISVIFKENVSRLVIEAWFLKKHVQGVTKTWTWTLDFGLLKRGLLQMDPPFLLVQNGLFGYPKHGLDGLWKKTKSFNYCHLTSDPLGNQAKKRIFLGNGFF